MTVKKRTPNSVNNCDSVISHVLDNASHSGEDLCPSNFKFRLPIEKLWHGQELHNEKQQGSITPKITAIVEWFIY